MEKNYIPKVNVKRRIHTIYTRHEYIQQLKGDITWFYKEYTRKRHLFKKDEWIFVRKIEEDAFKREVIRYQDLCWENFDYRHLVLEGEGYCDVGWD